MKYCFYLLILLLGLSCKKEDATGARCSGQNVVTKPQSGDFFIPQNRYLIYLPGNTAVKSYLSKLPSLSGGYSFIREYTAINAALVQLDAAALRILEKDSKLLVEAIQPLSIGQSCDSEPIDDIPNQAKPWGIGRVRAKNNYTGSAKAWILDTGIDLDHPDLNVDQDLSRDFVGSSGLLGFPIGVFANDVNGHGTHVAGTVGAINNSFGVIGVAPNVSLVACKVLGDDGRGNSGDLMNALDYVSTNGNAGDVINLSLGGGNSFLLNQMIQNMGARGFLFAMAAGNESQNASNTSPASANGTGLYTVSAFDRFGIFASFSNFGNPPIDFASPGVDVLSTLPDGKYGYKSGTSMAAPHMAGMLLYGEDNIAVDGNVQRDKDNNPDPIAVHSAAAS